MSIFNTISNCRDALSNAEYNTKIISDTVYEMQTLLECYRSATEWGLFIDENRVGFSVRTDKEVTLFKCETVKELDNWLIEHSRKAGCRNV